MVFPRLCRMHSTWFATMSENVVLFITFPVLLVTDICLMHLLKGISVCCHAQLLQNALHPVSSSNLYAGMGCSCNKQHPNLCDQVSHGHDCYLQCADCSCSLLRIRFIEGIVLSFFILKLMFHMSYVCKLCLLYGKW